MYGAAPETPAENEPLDSPSRRGGGGGATRYIIAAVVAIAALAWFMYRPGPTLALAEDAAWSKSWNDSVRRSQSTRKPALVLYTADWCPACRWFESNVLVRGDVRGYMESRYTPIMVDLTKPDSPNQAFARQYKIDVIPTLVLYNADGRELSRTNVLPPEQLLAWLRSDGRSTHQRFPLDNLCSRGTLARHFTRGRSRMPDLADGETFLMQGSGAKPYELKNVGGVYSCTCPAWRNQSLGIEKRTCKHLKKLRGEAAEIARVGSANAPPPRTPKSEKRAAAQEKAAPVLLAEVWDEAIDPAGWWMSEKLDGMRAYWDGSQLFSRLGNIIHAPDYFIARLPKQPLDGELFLARKSFQKTCAICRRQDKPDTWKQLKFLVFDAPAHGGEFEERLEFIQSLAKHDYATPHPHARCKSIAHLKEELARIEALGGEGLMLRQPKSKYTAGRSATLLKVKSFKDDEAIVIAHQAGAGKHKGRLGALLVRLADGTEFAIGTGFSDKERESPPPVGVTVVFRYQELSDGGVPRFPSFHAVREEV